MSRSMKHVLFALLGITLLQPAAAQTDAVDESQSLTILSSASPETQFMALVLTGAVMKEGRRSKILLCDGAGDLALNDANAPEAPAIAPPNRTPRQLLRKLQSDGAAIQVCAIYLPNRPHDKADLLDGVSVATPSEIGAMMADPDIPVFSF